jgi:hypothetical protein
MAESVGTGVLAKEDELRVESMSESRPVIGHGIEDESEEAYNRDEAVIAQYDVEVVEERSTFPIV